MLIMYHTRSTIYPIFGVECSLIRTANGGEMCLARSRGKHVLIIPMFLWDRVAHDGTITLWEIANVKNLYHDMVGMGIANPAIPAGLLMEFE